jgi:hypothetical protein
MPLQGVLDDREPQPGTAAVARAARIDAVKPLGETRDVFRRYADAVVGHGEVGAFVVAPPTHAHGAVGQRVLDAVHQEVGERRFEFLHRTEQAILGHEFQRHLAPRFASRQRIPLQTLQHARHVHGVAQRLAIGGLEPRQLQQVRDDGVHALRLGAHVANRPVPGRIDRRIVGQRIQVAGNHRERRAQFMGGVRHEVLAHGLEPHLTGHVPYQQQGLARPVGNQLKSQIRVELHRWADHDRERKVVAMQVHHELRRADQIVHPQADVDRAFQSQQPRRLAVEPDDLMLAAQDDDAIGQRRRGASQFAIQLREPLFVKLLAAVQTPDLADHVAPDTADVRRIDLRAQAQPPIEPMQIDQLPAEVAANSRQQPHPNRADEQADHQAREQDAGEPSERKSPHRCHG